jgi:hypothetical protein
MEPVDKEPVITQFYARKYQGTQTLNMYRNWLLHMMKQWGSRKFFSPYAALCQSSGYGKSKLMVEMGNFFHVFYVCLRPSLSLEIPARTRPVADMLFSCKTEADYQKYLLSCIEVAADENYQDHTELFRMFKDEDRARLFWHKVVEKCLTPSVKQSGGRLQERLLFGSSSDGILFVFDEARTLLEHGPGVTGGHGIEHSSRFQNITTALTDAAGGGPSSLFAVFIDATSSISKFTPALWNDPSARRFFSGLDLFAPGFVMPIGQVSADKQKIDTPVTWPLENGGRCIDSLSSLVVLSRPMFVVKWELACKENRSVMRAWDSVHKMAVCKLLNTAVAKFPTDLLVKADVNPHQRDDKLHTTPSKQADELAVAVLSSRISFIPHTVDKDSLVGSHMATLQGVSEDRSQQRVAYVAEPMLGEAAAWIWGLNNGKHLNDLILRFRGCIKAGFLGNIRNARVLGDVAASILLCKAFDECNRHLGELASENSTETTAQKFASSSSSSSSASAASADPFSLRRVPYCAAVPVIAFIQRIFDASESRKTFEKPPHGSSRSGVPKAASFASGSRLGSDGPLDCLQLTRWERGEVSVTQFVTAEEHVTMAMLVNAAKRRVGLKCPKDEYDVDAVLPVVFGKDDPDGGWTVDLDNIGPDDVGVILFQFKNNNKTVLIPSEVSEFAYKISDYAEGFASNVPYLGVIMAVGTQRIYKQGERYETPVWLQQPRISWTREELESIRNDSELRMTQADAYAPDAAIPAAQELQTTEVAADAFDADYISSELPDENFVFGFDSFYEDEKAVLFPKETLKVLKDIATMDPCEQIDEFCKITATDDTVYVRRMNDVFCCDVSGQTPSAEQMNARAFDRRHPVTVCVTPVSPCTLFIGK